MSPGFVVTELVVADMAAALAFYRKLGLDAPADADAEPHDDIELPGGQRSSCDTHETIRAFDAEWTPPSGGGRSIALAFECDSPGDVDVTFSTLTAAGYAGHQLPWDAFWGQRYAVVLDPDGNTVDLFAPLPG